jgi:hypothetical protein
MSDPSSSQLAVDLPNVAAVQKRQYRNQTAGWLGVVVLSPRGEEAGVSIPPFGTRWLSDAEAILTSRAPENPKDNPFEEKAFWEVDPDNPGGGKIERKIRPLVLIEDARYTPAEERYLPPEITGAHATQEASQAGAGEAPVVVNSDPVAVKKKEEEVLGQNAAPAVATERAGEKVDASEGAPQQPSPSAPVVPIPDPQTFPQPPMEAPQTPASQPAPAGAEEDASEPTPATSGEAWVDPATGENAQSWTEPPEPGQVVTGQLGGETAEDAPPPPAVDVPSSPVASEETAAEVDQSVGEETGAALPPSGEPEEGEYAEHEEVATPEAADQGSD